MSNPILTWVGGKRWLYPFIYPIIRRININHIMELFAGGAAISFRLEYKYVNLNDRNKHLINFYKQIQKGIDIFSSDIDFSLDEKVFYNNRDKFNEMIKENKIDTPEFAALFYYINKYSYGCKITYNSKGLLKSTYNKNGVIHNRVTTFDKFKFDIEKYHQIMKDWILTSEDFENIEINPNMIIYADPPYDQTFSKYTAEDFVWDDQVRLFNFLKSLSNPIILSNQATDRIINLYSLSDFKVKIIEAPRSIDIRGGEHKHTKEILAFRNIPDDIYDIIENINKENKNIGLFD